MPPKRKRNPKKDSNSKVGNQKSDDATLNDLSQSRSRCSAAIQVIPSAPFRPSATGIADDDAYTDAHLLVLGIYITNALLSAPKQETDQHITVEKSKAFVLAFLASRLSLILLQDKNQLERVCNASLSSVSEINEGMVVLGKALISTVCASIASFQLLVSSQPKDAEKDTNLMAWAMWTNINTLERLLNTSKKRVTPSIEIDPDSAMQPKVHTLPLTAERHAIWSSICEGMDVDKTNGLLQSTAKSKTKAFGTVSSHVLDPSELFDYCKLLESSSCITGEHVTFLATFLDPKSEDGASPPSKRKRKVVEAKQAGPAKELSSIMEGNFFGAKMILTKFVSTVLVNYCKGKHLLLDATEQMMKNCEYWANVMHTESLSLERQDLKSDKKKKKKKTVQVKPSRNLCLNVFASRVIDLIHDAGKHLTLDQVAEVDQYVSGTCTWDHFQQKILNRNLCNITIALIKSMLNIHKKCLMEIALAAANDLEAFETYVSKTKDHSTIYLLVNQEEQQENFSTSELSMFHPTISNSFEMLIKAISTETGVNESKESRIVTAIIASLGIKECIATVEDDCTPNQSKIDKILVCDAKLASFVVSQAEGAITSLFQYTNNVVKGYDAEGCSELSSAMVQTFLLDKPLLLDHSKEYTGIFSESAANDIHENFVIRDGYFLGLFLRTFLHTGGKVSKADVSKTPQELMKAFLDIISCCLRFKKNTPISYSDDKIAANSRNIFTRSNLAADCLDNISRCIAFVMLSSEAVNEIVCDEMRLAIQLRTVLRHTLRPCILIPSLIEIGVNIEELYITNCNTSKGASAQQNNSCLRFSEWEKRLWTSHVRCCLAFGRGNAKPIYYYGNSSVKRRFWIGTPIEKTDLFEKILSDMNYDTLLYFPTSTHAILASSTASDPIPKISKDAAPEILLCNKVFNAVIRSLNDPDITILSRSIDGSQDNVPLPKRDAQLVVISLGRIPRKEQQKMLSRFVRELESAIIKIKDTYRLRNLMQTNKRYSSLLAKTITLCSHMIDMICIGKSHTDLFSDYVSDTFYDLDNIRKQISGKDNEFSEWYKYQSYVGLWRESFSPDLPPMKDILSFNEPLSPREIISYTSILDIGLELGFDSARSDKCYLLYSAWNAGTKAIPYTPKEWFSTLSTTGWSNNGHGKQLRAIWELMCNLYEALETSEYTPDSLLSTLIKKKSITNQEPNRQESGVALLKSSVKKCVEILNNVSTESLNCKEKCSLRYSSGDCVVLEATLGLISFLAAMFTRHDQDYIYLMGKYYRRRRKTNSFSGESLGDDDLRSENGSNDSEEDGFHDSDEDMEDDDMVTIEGVRKLEDACMSLGASPLHPDWLDSSCRLRPYITDIECIQLAECMLSSLTSFGARMNEKFDTQLKDALLAHSTDCVVDEYMYNSAIEVVRSISFSDKRAQTKSSLLWKQELASTFHLDESFIEAMCNDFPCKNTKFAKETFAVHAPSRIRGALCDFCRHGYEWLPSQAVYPSIGEWELLFSDSFVGACADLHLSTHQNSDVSKFAELLQTKRLMQSTLSATVSVNALLRFGISGSMGPSQLSSIFTSENNISKYIPPHHTVEISRYLNQKSLSQKEMRHIINSINNSLCFLARIQAQGYQGHLKKIARAALCHLVSRDTDVLNLETPYALHTTIHALQKLVQSDENVVNLIDKVVESSHFSHETENGLDKLLLLTLGYRVNIRVCSVADAFTDVRNLYRSIDLNTKYLEDVPARYIDFFCDILFGESNVPSVTRLKLLNAFRDTLSAEDISSTSNGLAENVLKVLNSRGDNALNTFVQNSICDCSDTDISLEISKVLCMILMLLVRPLKKFIQTSQLDFFRSTMNCLRKNMRFWISDSNLKHILCLTAFLSVLLGIVKEICDELLSHVSEENGIENLNSLELFYKFINDCHKILCEGNPEDQIIFKASPPYEMSGVQQVKPLSMPNCCTYTSTAAEFIQQHWYNCYTCGLVYDKGCCSLCAQICHKGHDVSYSRKSSFFCDCGAEVRTNMGRLKCKCLSPLSQASLSSLLSNSIDTPTSMIHTQSFENYWQDAIALLKVYFPDIAKNAIASFVQTIEPTLIEQLFRYFDQYFDSCLNRESFQKSFQRFLKSNEGAVPSHRDELNMTLRSFKESNLSCFEKDGVMNLLQSSKRNIVSVSLNTDSSIDRTKKLLLAKDSLVRNAIITDSRGRMIIAESKGLLFCSTTSLLNTCYVHYPNEGMFDRRQLCVLGQKAVDFSIVGMIQCPGRNRQLVLWGFSTAAVFIVNKAYDDIQFSIQLITNIDKDECGSKYIVKAEWLTDSILVLFCATCIHIYDIEKHCTENDLKFSCAPSLSYIIGTDERTIKSGVIISSNRINEPHSFTVSSLTYPRKRIVVMCDDGCMSAIDIDFDMNGSLESKGEFIVDGDALLSFPLPKKINHQSTIFGSENTKTNSLGDGSLLHFLPQSYLLLYKCSSSDLIAFTLNDNCEITGSFEFLPRIISSDVIGDPALGSVYGPYTNFCELGFRETDDHSSYRLAFTAKSVRSNSPQLMYMEFNQQFSKVKRLNSKNNLNHIMSSTLAFDGVAALSAPKIYTDPTIKDSTRARVSFVERLYMISLMSNGCISLYSDDPNMYGSEEHSAQSYTHDSLTSRLDNHGDRVKFRDSIVKELNIPAFPLNYFEKLKNITKEECIVLGGEGFSEDEATLKRKLCTGSQEYVVCSSRDGCTLNLCLQRNATQITGTTNIFDPSTHAIVAVRFLLGTSQTDYFPKEVSVLGRQLKIHRQKKRWYDVPLTDEEVILVVRSGVVSISILGATDSEKNRPTIDAIEVYAEERANLRHLFPIHILPTPCPQLHVCEENGMADESSTRSALNICVLTLSHILQMIVKSTNSVSAVTESSLQRLIEATTIASNTTDSFKENVAELVLAIKRDKKASDYLLDHGTLKGIYTVLQNLQEIMETSEFLTLIKNKKMMAGHFFESIFAKLNLCLSKATEIVKMRPGNYKNVLEQLISSGITQSSIALSAKAILNHCPTSKQIVQSMELLVELIIHEASWSHESSFCSRKEFASLKDLSTILTRSDELIVEHCCSRVLKVVRDLTDHLILSHQCDSCGICPISNTRYTMDEDDYDIDLCQKCYEDGSLYAKLKSYDANLPVLIDNQRVYVSGLGKPLSCADIKKMAPKFVPILQHQTITCDHEKTLSSDSEVDEDLQTALRMSMEGQDESGIMYMPMQVQISNTLLDIVIHSFTEDRSIVNTITVINLLLKLALQCKDDDIKRDLCKKMCESLCKEIGNACKVYVAQQVDRRQLLRLKSALISYTRTLISLLRGKDDVESAFLQPNELTNEFNSVKITAPSSRKRKTDPRFICNVHGIPAVRRRCSHGENKEKRFYVCGMERKQRCNYFKWTDDVPSQAKRDTKVVSGSTAFQSKASNFMDSKIQSILWKQLNKGTPPAHNHICALLIHFIQSSPDDLSSPEAPELERATATIRNHLHSTRETSDDENDGITSATHILSWDPTNKSVGLRRTNSPSLLHSEQNVVKICLQFLSSVASFVFASFSEWNVWYAPLSHIIGKSHSSSLRSEAKTLLKCLCRGDKARYHQIRDSFVFASEFTNILLLCETPFCAARDVVEKSRLCGPNWQDAMNLSWNNMKLGSFLGTHDLISEDAFVTENMEKLRMAVDNLVEVAKSRVNNWRQFCCLKALPKSDTNGTNYIFDGIISLSECTPIRFLFWLVCILPSDFLGDMLFLFGAALQGNAVEKSCTNVFKLGPNNSMNTQPSLGCNTGNKTPVEIDSKDPEVSESPAVLLLNGGNGLSLSDIFSFVTIFVIKGNTLEIRSQAAEAARSLMTIFVLHHSPPKVELETFLQKMMTVCLKDVGALGVTATEFLKFMNTLFSIDSIWNNVDKTFFFRSSVCCYAGQVAYDNSNPRSSRNIILTKSQVNKVSTDLIVLSRCRHCESRSTLHIEKTKSQKEIASKKRKSSDASESDVTSIAPSKWARSQLSEFHRIRLDMQHSVSTEFTSFIQLRSRYSISDVFLNVRDQRGRFVKCINIYFSPKPVGDVNTLAEAHYGPFWQLIGTITLSKGASSASYKLKTPVVAANLKFEYVEFYEKVTGQKTASGAMVLHCPRCTRIVNNAHGGVCGHCGEVAFQCRKCRHINYDQLDAFLCVECGYCSSGTFTWELNAGVASCAVAIENEDDYERSVRMLQANNRKVAEIRENLELVKDQIEKKSSSTSLETMNMKCSHSDPMTLAISNKLPRFVGTIQSNKIKSQDKEHSFDPSVNSRTQSLLNLARSLRGDGGSDIRSTLGDFILQHTRMRGNLPFDDDDMIVDEANSLPFGISDPLTRLVARLEGRSRGNTSVTSRSNIDLTAQKEKGTKGKKNDIVQNLIDEAKRLYTQMRIMERGSYELESRIIAWKRLNRDDIAPRGYIAPSIEYNPSTCSNCSPSLTFHLLEIVHTLLESDTQSAHCILDAQFIRCLFDEQEVEKPNLTLLKRSVLVTIAKNSEEGSLLILDELRCRLAGARDTGSAEILGTLLESQVKNEDKFADLALRTLSS